MKELFRVAYELDRRNLPFALVTVIGTDGIIPRQNGRMLVREDGSFTSTIGGHLIEDEAVKASMEAIREGRGRRLNVDTGKGSMELMIDVVNQKRMAYLIGYGHVGKALAATLHSIGFSVHIYDIRPVECDWAAEIHVGDCWKDILSGLVLDSRSSLIVTVHSKEDILSYIDYSSASYVGVMGTRSRVMPDKGIHTPAGLDVGAETPEEVAVSISAEILRLYNRHSGMSSRERRWRFVVVRGCDEYAAAAIMRLKGAGYDVIDLGVNCDIAKYEEGVKQGATIVGCSSLLTTTMPYMKEVVEHFKGTGVKVIIGGAPVTQTYADEIGADGYSEDANGAVKLVDSILKIA